MRCAIRLVTLVGCQEGLKMISFRRAKSHGQEAFLSW
jgi:hypothetical protein